MKKWWICCLALLLPFWVFSQKEGDIWFFGESVLMDFATAPPIVNSNAIITSIEGSSSLSTNNGVLMFYANGGSLYDGNLQPLNNWVAPNSSYNGGDVIAQGVLLLPIHDSLAYYFARGLGATPGYGTACYVASINPQLNGGLGSVLSTHNLIADSLAEQLSAVRHADGKTWWLVSHTTRSDRFLIWHIDEVGNFTLHTQHIGAVHPPLWVSYSSPLVFNQQGNQCVLTSRLGRVELYDFDRCNGLLTLVDTIVKPEVFENSYYGLSFSPSGKYLYVSDRIFGTPGDSLGYSSKLYQYDVSAPNLQASEFLLFTGEPPCPGSPNLCRRTWGGHKLGPDGKIYIGNASDDGKLSIFDSLSVIQNPDAAGFACDYRHLSFPVNPGRTNAFFPNIPNYRLGPLTPYPANAGPDQYYCIGGTPVTLGVPDTSGGIVTYHWQVHTGPGSLSDTSTAQPSTSPGDTTVYLLTCIDLTLGPDCGTTTDTVTVFPRQPVALDAGPDGTICLGDAEPTSITLGPANSNNELCHWESEFGLAWTLASLDDRTSCNPVAKPYETTVYTLVSQDIENGCPEMRDQVTVSVEPCDIEIQNVITPNGDGINDVFFIKNLPLGSRVFVYDRWGSEVYGSDNYGNDWVPKASVPEGVYYYSVQSVRVKTGVVAEKVGTLTLLR